MIRNLDSFSRNGITKIICRIFRPIQLPAASGFNIDLRCIHDKTELQFQTQFLHSVSNG